MKITFDSLGKEYIECVRKDHEICITISSLDPNNHRARIISTASLTIEEWKNLVSNISIE